MNSQKKNFWWIFSLITFFGCFVALVALEFLISNIFFQNEPAPKLNPLGNNSYIKICLYLNVIFSIFSGITTYLFSREEKYLLKIIAGTGSSIIVFITVWIPLVMILISTYGE